MTLSETIVLAIILVVIAVVVIAYLELKFLRKSMRARRVRAARRIEELPDDAHNALITTKAILGTMERNGTRSEEAAALLEEAKAAYDRRNYRVVLDLTSQAKEKLMALKARQQAQGDLVKIEASSRGGAEEVTTKELLQKEYPPNYMPAKFSIELARAAIEEARASGRDTSKAEEHLMAAMAKFDAKDYAGALAAARMSQRAAEGLPTEAAPAMAKPEPAILACASCGAALREDDVFCRKCGARVGPKTCPSCGATVAADDAFCRRCGAAVAR